MNWSFLVNLGCFAAVLPQFYRIQILQKYVVEDAPVASRLIEPDESAGNVLQLIGCTVEQEASFELDDQ